MFATRSSRTADRTIVDGHGEDVDAVKEKFGYADSSHWVIDPNDGLRQLSTESDPVSDEFAAVTQAILG